MVLVELRFGWMGQFFDFFLAVALGVAALGVVALGIAFFGVAAAVVLLGVGWVVLGGGGLWTWRVLCGLLCRV